MIATATPPQKTKTTATIEEIYAKRIGANIAALRKYRNLTQLQLVTIINEQSGGEYLYRQALSRTEVGVESPPIYELEAFSNYFKIPLYSLVHASTMAEMVEAIYAHQHNQA